MKIFRLKGLLLSIIAVAMAAFIGVSLTACSSDDDDKTAGLPAYVGQWKVVSTEGMYATLPEHYAEAYFEFKANNNLCNFIRLSPQAAADLDLDENKYYMISEGKMEMVQAEDTSGQFTLKGDSPIAIPFAYQVKGEQMTLAWLIAVPISKYIMQKVSTPLQYEVLTKAKVDEIIDYGQE